MMWLAAVTAATIAALIVEMVLHHRSEVRWQKMFALRMELPPIEEPKTQVAPAPVSDGRRRVMVKIPGMEMFKRS